MQGNPGAYIPTNLISITDGQIVFDTKLFRMKDESPPSTSAPASAGLGARPRLTPRDTAKTLRLDYAQFLELEMFTRFGGVLNSRVRDQLTRGARIAPSAINSMLGHIPTRSPWCWRFSRFAGPAFAASRDRIPARLR